MIEFAEYSDERDVSRKWNYGSKFKLLWISELLAVLLIIEGIEKTCCGREIFLDNRYCDQTEINAGIIEFRFNRNQ